MRSYNSILVLLIFLLAFFYKGFCQENVLIGNEIDHVNLLDSSGNKIGLWIEYDIENIKYSETRYSKPNKVDYTKYFTRNGTEIKKYSWRINSFSLNRLIESTKNNFIYDDLSAGVGSAILLLIADCKNNIFEIRIIKGVSKGFNNELLRVTKDLENNLIFICPDNYKTPIIIPFSIHAH